LRGGWLIKQCHLNDPKEADTGVPIENVVDQLADNSVT
jgi:hypothetical protein